MDIEAAPPTQRRLGVLGILFFGSLGGYIAICSLSSALFVDGLLFYPVSFGILWAASRLFGSVRQRWAQR
jgi:hypothetical protein